MAERSKDNCRCFNKLLVKSAERFSGNDKRGCSGKPGLGEGTHEPS